MSVPLYAHAEKFVRWLLRRVVEDARGDRLDRLDVAPSGRFWLGRIAPEDRTAASIFGERGERMDPCAVGIRLLPATIDGRAIRARVRAVAWMRDPGGSGDWVKGATVEEVVTVNAPLQEGMVERAGRAQLAAAFKGTGFPDNTAEVRAELELGRAGLELVVTIVNVTPDGKDDPIDRNLYEVSLEIDAGATKPFQLDALEDSFRYSRDVPAYGINCAVDVVRDGVFRTSDVAESPRLRPEYWDAQFAGAAPDLSFSALALDPLPQVRGLGAGLRRWRDCGWSKTVLDRRAREGQWSAEMRIKADEAAKRFDSELARIERGVEMLEKDEQFLRAFKLTNAAFDRSRLQHRAWRPFQIGFLLAALPSVHPDTARDEADLVDTLWFATGGGKTEVYLAVLVMTAFVDRLRGKVTGIGAWVRFPLRMLSLQQMQRFADIIAAAELVRAEEAIVGGVFQLGFFVGAQATPNEIKAEPKADEPDPNDPEMPARFQVLLRCPFCGSKKLTMRFDRRRWALDHHCGAEGCPWGDKPLPFRVVDAEIYRFLPTVVIGTLDKAASLGMQSAMRCFYAAPIGLCPIKGHGFTYISRFTTPTGCLYPGCREKAGPLPQNAVLFPPTLRIQDELHLLRDALGAVDAHYESLLDHNQAAHGHKSKILASSATLQGYEHQSKILFNREGRLFPEPGPWNDRSPWSQDTKELMRLFAGVAPRGTTIDFATDRTNYSVQRAIRDAVERPDDVAREVDVPVKAIEGLVCYYGVGVVYGPTIRDVEAAARSFQTQIPIQDLRHVTLTGSTPFPEVRDALERFATDCDRPFSERIHLVAASSMLSHGVDVDRFNVMVMLGLPLSTAELIQTTSRVGRRLPALVVVMHKINRERDAAVFRTFVPFIQHADRLIDHIPITRRSRKVLEITFPGLYQGRLLGVHEERAVKAGLKPLTTVPAIRTAIARLPLDEEDEYDALVEMLGLNGELDENIRTDLRQLVRETYRNVNDPATSEIFLSKVLPGNGPMLSLRDVEEQVPVYTREGF
jgi:helicase-like protein